MTYHLCCLLFNIPISRSSKVLYLYLCCEHISHLCTKSSKNCVLYLLCMYLPFYIKSLVSQSLLGIFLFTTCPMFYDILQLAHKLIFVQNCVYINQIWGRELVQTQKSFYWINLIYKEKVILGFIPHDPGSYLDYADPKNEWIVIPFVHVFQ